jgi:DNA recombination-dependent growth factor C
MSELSDTNCEIKNAEAGGGILQSKEQKLEMDGMQNYRSSS